MSTTSSPSGLEGLSRARGALLGLACGDALGTTLELESPALPPPFPALLTGPHRTITGGGPFHLLPGQVTDDTQMAVCLATSLRVKGGYNVADAARRYEAWAGVAFDKGGQTSAALELVAAGVPAEDAGRKVWAQGGRQAAGNGSLMRTAPIGVLLAGSATQRRKAALLDSAVTHFDPRCLLACTSFDAAIAHAVGTEGPLVAGDLVTAAREEIPIAARNAEIHVIQVNLRDAPESAGRRQLLQIPTALSISGEEVDNLIEAGGHILRNSPEFKALRESLGVVVQ